MFTKNNYSENQPIFTKNQLKSYVQNAALKYWVMATVSIYEVIQRNVRQETMTFWIYGQLRDSYNIYNGHIMHLRNKYANWNNFITKSVTSCVLLSNYF